MESFRPPCVHSLLSNLKSIVELVIKFPGGSLVTQYGAIERIRSAILSILLHGFKQVCVIYIFYSLKICQVLTVFLIIQGRKVNF